MTNRFRVVFYGTPEFALPTLELLLRHHEIVAVVTQPDRPAHRGQRLSPPPVKTRALAAGLEILQPPRLRDPEWPDRLRALDADVAVVAAFGQILPKAVLDALTPTPQRHEDATYAPRLKRADGYLDWSRSARELVNLVRGCNPWPGAVARGPAGTLTIWRATALGTGPTLAPGTLGRPTAESDELAIATADGWLRPVEVQPENRRAMSWSDYLRGARIAPGVTFVKPDAVGPAS